jgi:hypothetical protein
MFSTSTTAAAASFSYEAASCVTRDDALALARSFSALI